MQCGKCLLWPLHLCGEIRLRESCLTRLHQLYSYCHSRRLGNRRVLWPVRGLPP